MYRSKILEPLSTLTTLIILRIKKSAKQGESGPVSISTFDTMRGKRVLYVCGFNSRTTARELADEFDR